MEDEKNNQNLKQNKLGYAINQALKTTDSVQKSITNRLVQRDEERGRFKAEDITTSYSPPPPLKTGVQDTSPSTDSYTSSSYASPKTNGSVHALVTQKDTITMNSDNNFRTTIRVNNEEHRRTSAEQRILKSDTSKNLLKEHSLSSLETQKMQQVSSQNHSLDLKKTQNPQKVGVQKDNTTSIQKNTGLKTTVNHQNLQRETDLKKLAYSIQDGNFKGKTNPSQVLQTRVPTEKNDTIQFKGVKAQTNPDIEIENIQKMLNKRKYSEMFDSEAKISLIDGLKKGKLSIDDVKKLLKQAKVANKYGINIKGKDGVVRSVTQLKTMGKLQKMIFGKNAGRSKFSKGLTANLKVGKVGNKIGKAASSNSTRFINATQVNPEEVGNMAHNQMKDRMKSVTVDKVAGYTQQKVQKWTFKGVKSMLKAAFQTLKAIVLKVVGVFATFGIGVMLPLALIVALLACLLTTFTGSAKTQTSYDTVFAAESSECQSRADDILKDLESRKQATPGKNQFENISDADYESLISTQYIPDIVRTQGSSNIDYKAQLALLQICSGAASVEDETPLGDILTLVRFWDDNEIIEKHTTSTSNYDYTVSWVAKKEVSVSEKGIGQSKNEAKANALSKIEGTDRGGYSIKKKKLTYTYTDNYEYKKIEKDGKIYEEKVYKDTTCVASGTLKLEKEMSKGMTQYIYTLHYENGSLDDYLNLSQKAVRENKILTVDNYTLGKERSFTHVETSGDLQRNKEIIWKFLKSKGYSDESTAGIMGNLYAESHFDPTAVEASNGEGHGLVQWSYERKERLFRMARERGVSWEDLGLQLDLLNDELEHWTWSNPNYKFYFASTDDLKKCTDLEKCTEAVVRCFERPKDHPSLLNTRIGFARDVYNDMKNTPGSTQGTQHTFGTKVSVSNRSKHWQRQYYYEELLSQSFTIHKYNQSGQPAETNNSQYDMDAIPTKTIAQIKELYGSDTLLDGFTFAKNGSNTSSSVYEAFGFDGSVRNPIKEENGRYDNYSVMNVPGNPFAVPQCTWFAWARFYQVYGYDSGARGNGNQNAYEIVSAHPDKFRLSSSPAPGAVFSISAGPYIIPEYGHVGFVEAVEGDTMWITEGNVTLDGHSGLMWFHKVSVSQFINENSCVFAVPIKK